MEFFVDLEIVAVTYRERRRGPLADAVHSENRGLFEWRGKKRRGGVRQVMLREQQVRIIVSGGNLSELCRQPILLEQLFSEPDRNGHLKRLEPPRRKSQVGLNQALKLDEWLIVENDEV